MFSAKSLPIYVQLKTAQHWLYINLYFYLPVAKQLPYTTTPKSFRFHVELCSSFDSTKICPKLEQNR